MSKQDYRYVMLDDGWTRSLVKSTKEVITGKPHYRLRTDGSSWHVEWTLRGLRTYWSADATVAMSRAKRDAWRLGVVSDPKTAASYLGVCTPVYPPPIGW